MLMRMKTLILGLSAAMFLGFSWASSFAQAMGPAALAARQHIKAEVVTAMADGKISAAERMEILAEAKEILKPEEYAGLVCTIERVSPSTNVLHANNSSARTMAKGVDAIQSHKVVSSEVVKKSTSATGNMLSEGPASNSSPVQRFLAQLPYIDESQMKTPPAHITLPRLTYVKPMEMDMAAGADKMAAWLPNLYNVYIDLEPPPIQRKQSSNLAKQSNKPKVNLATTEKVRSRRVVAEKKDTSSSQLARTEKKEKTPVQVAKVEKKVKQQKQAELAKNPSVANAQAATEKHTAAKSPVKQSKTSTVTNAQAASEKPAALKTSVTQTKSSIATNAQAATEKPKILKAQLAVAQNPPVNNQPAKVREPERLLTKAERTGIAHYYADYSVPVLNTPGAAFLSSAEKKSSTEKVTFEQPLAPDPDAYVTRR